MNFSDAFEAVKRAGFRARRPSFAARSFIYLIPGSSASAPAPADHLLQGIDWNLFEDGYEDEDGCTRTRLPSLGLSTTDGDGPVYSTWTPSQADLFAEDWEIFKASD